MTRKIRSRLLGGLLFASAFATLAVAPFPSFADTAVTEKTAIPDDLALVRELDAYLSTIFPADEPGAAILIARNGKPIYRRGFGLADVERKLPVTPKTIWTGSDDGKVYLTRDGGVKRTDVTPRDKAKFSRVSSIDASKFGECIAYLAANRFQLDDQRPYL